MTMSKGFIFDLDGVIVDTAKYHYLAWKNLADSLHIPFSELKNEQLKGVSRVESLKKILEWGGLSLSEARFEEIMADKNEHYLSYISEMTETEILPDVVKVLDFLNARGQKTALGSASKNARTILQKVGLESYFETIVDGNSVTKAKPDPEVFLNAAKGLGIDAAKCVVFEDALAGIQAANSAGMISIGIGSEVILKEADHVFRDFTEMSADFIEELIKK